MLQLFHPSEQIFAAVILGLCTLAGALVNAAIHIHSRSVAAAATAKRKPPPRRKLRLVRGRFLYLALGLTVLLAVNAVRQQSPGPAGNEAGEAVTEARGEEARTGEATRGSVPYPRLTWDYWTATLLPVAPAGDAPAQPEGTADRTRSRPTDASDPRTSAQGDESAGATATNPQSGDTPGTSGILAEAGTARSGSRAASPTGADPATRRSALELSSGRFASAPLAAAPVPGPDRSAPAPPVEPPPSHFADPDQLASWLRADGTRIRYRYAEYLPDACSSGIVARGNWSEDRSPALAVRCLEEGWLELNMAPLIAARMLTPNLTYCFRLDAEAGDWGRHATAPAPGAADLGIGLAAEPGGIGANIGFRVVHGAGGARVVFTNAYPRVAC